MKAAVYTRVSSPRQEDGTSLDTQQQACIERANSLGYSVDEAHVWRDRGFGWDPDRPGMKNLKAVLATGEIEMLIAYTPDRIARNPQQLLTFMEYLDEIGVGFQFVNGPSGNSPEERLMQYFFGYVGQRERLDIAERTNRGKRKVAEGGRLPIGTGAGLYGYDYDTQTKMRTINPIESVIVQKIFRDYADGKSLYAIGCDLNQAGVTTKRGSTWHPITIGRILENTSYKGETWFGKHRWRSVRGGKVVKEDPPDNAPPVPLKDFTPPIISDALFQQVQERLSMPKARTKSTGKYWLTGFLRCESCGSPVSGTSLRGGYRYYRCRATAPTTQRPATCNARYINADKLEKSVWNHVSNLISNPEMIVQNIRDYMETGGGDLSAEIKRLTRKISRCREQERKLLNLYTNDSIDEDMLTAQIAPIKLSREQFQTGLRDLEEQQAFNEDVKVIERRVREYYQSIGDGLDQESYDGKRAALAAFDVKAVVSRENIVINVTVDPGFTAIEHTWA